MSETGDIVISEVVEAADASDVVEVVEDSAASKAIYKETLEYIVNNKKALSTLLYAISQIMTPLLKARPHAVKFVITSSLVANSCRIKDKSLRDLVLGLCEYHMGRITNGECHRVVLSAAELASQNVTSIIRSRVQTEMKTMPESFDIYVDLIYSGLPRCVSKSSAILSSTEMMNPVTIWEISAYDYCWVKDAITELECLLRRVKNDKHHLAFAMAHLRLPRWPVDPVAADAVAAARVILPARSGAGAGAGADADADAGVHGASAARYQDETRDTGLLDVMGQTPSRSSPQKRRR
jgi:hypothetical protein